MRYFGQDEATAATTAPAATAAETALPEDWDAVAAAELMAMEAASEDPVEGVSPILDFLDQGWTQTAPGDASLPSVTQMLPTLADLPAGWAPQVLDNQGSLPFCPAGYVEAYYDQTGEVNKLTIPNAHGCKPVSEDESSVAALQQQIRDEQSGGAFSVAGSPPRSDRLAYIHWVLQNQRSHAESLQLMAMMRPLTSLEKVEAAKAQLILLQQLRNFVDGGVEILGDSDVPKVDFTNSPNYLVLDMSPELFYQSIPVALQKQKTYIEASKADVPLPQKITGGKDDKGCTHWDLMCKYKTLSTKDRKIANIAMIAAGFYILGRMMR
jgi:hypothetical protein